MRAKQSIRRFPYLYLLALALFTLFVLTSFRRMTDHSQESRSPTALNGLKDEAADQRFPGKAAERLLTGKAIAPKLENATLKAELGRAAWKLFHTTFARFPDKPTPEESEDLRTWVHLSQRLYPCGECAEHFGTILKKFPPQVSSRSAAAAWGCHVHNEVNKSLKKELFDCSNIGDFYDCGCAEDTKNSDKGKKTKKEERGLKAEKTIIEEMGWTKGG